MHFELHLQRNNFKEYKGFDVSSIRFDQAVRNICEQNACGQYGRSHMCPPAVKGVEEWKKEILSYENAVMVTKVYPIKNSYDIKAMFEGLADFQNTLVRIKEDVVNQFPDKKYMFLGAGTCFICEKCAYRDGEPCRYPEKAFPSLEACGIDVMSLSMSVGVKYNNGQNTVTYMGVILYS